MNIKKRKKILCFIILFTFRLHGLGDFTGEQAFTFRCEMDRAIGKFVCRHEIPEIKKPKLIPITTNSAQTIEAKKAA